MKPKELANRVKTNAPKMWQQFPVATGAVAIVFFLLGVIVGNWL